MNTQYVLVVDGQRISEPMTMKQIQERFGSIKKLERTGIRIVSWNGGAK